MPREKANYTWKDCTSPYPRAGLWYVHNTESSTLFEAWAQTPEGADKGPEGINDSDFRYRVIGGPPD